jgi:hypothetical protein
VTTRKKDTVRYSERGRIEANASLSDHKRDTSGELRVVAGRQLAGSIVDYARKIAGDKKHSIELAQRAKIVTKSGQLSAHYKKK